MSDSFITFLRVTSERREAVEAIDSAVAWLVGEGVIAARGGGRSRLLYVRL